MNKQGEGMVEVDCAGGCGIKVRRHPQRASKVSFSVCGPKCRGKVQGLRYQKITDDQVIAAQLEFLEGKRTKADISKELGVSRCTINARINKLRKQGVNI